MRSYGKSEMKEIIKLMKSTKDTRMYSRYLVIFLYMKGNTNKHIASIVNVTEHTVGIYINNFKQNGVEGLIPVKPSGRPRFLSEKQELQLFETIRDKTPSDVGFAPFMNWTVKFVVLWVEKEFGVLFTVGGMTDLLHRINLSYTRPTYVLAKADLEKQAQFIEDFEAVKKKLQYDEIDHILFEDESTIRNYQAIMKTWFPKGLQRIIKTYGKHEGVKLTGVINYETGSIYVEENLDFNAEIFKSFLENILKRYPKGKIVMILDNSKVHHAKLLAEFLQNNPRLQLMFLPPYSPNLNIIEGLWGWLKDSCINNVFFSKVYEINLAVRKFVDFVNQTPDVVIDRLCVQM